MLQLRYADGTYVFDCTYDYRDIPKGAGFRWNPKAKQWATSNHEHALKLKQYATEPARQALIAAERQAQETLAASRATDAAVDIPAPEGLEYLPFQRAGIRFCLERPAVLLTDEMGLGKTVQAIGLINADPSLRHILIVCPAMLRLNWRRELERWLVRPYSIGVVEGTKAHAWPEAAEITIINYDVLTAHSERIHDKPWDLLICDEAHYAKNPKAQRSRQILGHWNRTARQWQPEPLKARRRLLLTGTPVLNRPAELYPLLHYLDRERWPKFFDFATRYCNARQGRFGWDFSGASRLDELQHKLRSTLMIRRLKSEVLTELPPKRRQLIEIPATSAKLKKAAKAELAAWEDQQKTIERLRRQLAEAKANKEHAPEAYKDAVVSLRDAQLVAFEGLSRLRYETAMAKLDIVIEFLGDAIESSSKVVCFAHHRDVVNAIADAFPGAQRIMGGMSVSAVESAKQCFQEGDCPLIVCNIQSGGTGHTLTASAHVVFAELDWVPANISQAEDRLHRIGATDTVLVQHLVLEGSLDARIAKTIIAKQNVIDKALDTGAEIPPEAQRSILEELLALPEREQQPPERPKPATKATNGASAPPQTTSLPAEAIAEIHRGLQVLAGQCDYASKRDDSGFNRYDAAIGHSLAGRPRLSERQAVLGARLLMKYHRQLDDGIIEAARKLLKLPTRAPVKEFELEG